uniref:Methyltransferase n=1 Tax=viral metagenome TaxID=1070528 RepID=A0A6C0BAS9_9ZZZZ
MLLNPALFKLPHHEIKSYGVEALTYGSLNEKGLASVVSRLLLVRQIQGFDLGCGDGELIWHLGHLLPGSTWCGVEISEQRVALQTRDVSIWQGDMLEESFHNYNVLHADNLCLDEKTADALEEKIANEFRGLYISYRRATNMKFLRKAVLLDSVLTETTWSSCVLHYYSIGVTPS